jgi:hypothetical protein
MGSITIERWKEAQQAETKYHRDPKEKLLKIYRDSYRQYFKYVGLGNDLQGKKIIEIGPAHIPALYFCTNYEGVIIEPMESEILRDITIEKNIRLIKEPAEYVDLKGYDEAWLFNVLQHVIDPDLLIYNIKRSVKLIRFFEPVNMGTAPQHPHAFTINDFINWFFTDTKIYPAKPSAKNFHTHECCYGVYKI